MSRGKAQGELPPDDLLQDERAIIYPWTC